MTPEAVAAEGRVHAEAAMADTCTITIPGSTKPTYDPVTLKANRPTGASLYAGKCWVSAPRTSGAGDNTAQAGDRLVYEQTRTVKVPAAVAQVPVGAVVEITASLDPDLTGRTFVVRAIEHKTFITARRLVCEEVTA